MAHFITQRLPGCVIHLDAVTALQLGQSFVEATTKLDLGNAGFGVDMTGNLNGVGESHEETLALIRLDFHPHFLSAGHVHFSDCVERPYIASHTQ